MPPKLTIFSAIILSFLAGALLATRLTTVHGPKQPGAGFAAVPGAKGRQPLHRRSTNRRVQKFRPRPGATPSSWSASRCTR